METTRHFTATIYAVHDGPVALHHHDRLDKLLAPGGHVDRDGLPREAARREVREECEALRASTSERGGTTRE